MAQPKGPLTMEDISTSSTSSNIETDDMSSVTSSMLGESQSILYSESQVSELPLAPTKRRTIHTVADENIKAVVGKDTVKAWSLGGAGVYHLRITRVSGVSAHCKGTVTVSRQDTGEVLWQHGPWRSDQNGVDASFAIPIAEDCIISVTMQAHHFCSSVVQAGRSVVQVCITQSASKIKGRFRREGTPIGAALTRSVKSLSFGDLECSSQDAKPARDFMKANSSVSGTSTWESMDDKLFEDPLMVQLVRAITRKVCKKHT